MELGNLLDLRHGSTAKALDVLKALSQLNAAKAQREDEAKSTNMHFSICPVVWMPKLLDKNTNFACFFRVFTVSKSKLSLVFPGFSNVFLCSPDFPDSNHGAWSCMEALSTVFTAAIKAIEVELRRGGGLDTTQRKFLREIYGNAGRQEENIWGKSGKNLGKMWGKSGWLCYVMLCMSIN